VTADAEDSRATNPVEPDASGRSLEWPDIARWRKAERERLIAARLATEAGSV
jgi:hypothetical protein